MFEIQGVWGVGDFLGFIVRVRAKGFYVVGFRALVSKGFGV